MSFTRSLTFNGFTASITLPTKLSNDQLEWTLAMKDDDFNTVSTSGVVDIEPVEPVKPVEPAVPVMDEVTKTKHVDFIKMCLATVEAANGRDARATAAKILYDYLLICGMDFLKAYEKFKQTVIDKAYELKKKAPEQIAMIASMNKVLSGLNVPLEKPVPVAEKPAEVKPVERRHADCGGNHATPLLKPVNPVVTPAKKLEEPSKEAPKSNDEQELTLFTALAKKYDFKKAIANPKEYFGYFNSAVRWNSYMVRGATKAEKMSSYFNHCTDIGQREALMKNIFDKHGMNFSDTVMPFYYGWESTYKPTGKTNRYIKMNEFATTHKSLFTPNAK
jgi:hypothetical protein